MGSPFHLRSHRMLSDINGLKSSGTFCIVLMQKDNYNTLGVQGLRTLVGFCKKEAAERWLKHREWISMQGDDPEAPEGKFNRDLWIKDAELAMVLPEAEIP